MKMTVNERLRSHLEERDKILEASYENERLTRMRVDALEAWAANAGLILARGFWGRLKWLLFGS